MTQQKQFLANAYPPLLAQATGQASGPAVQAATPIASPITLQPEFGFTSLSQAINTLLSFMMFAAAIATLLFLLLAAFRYITAGDSEQNTRAARRMVSNAIVGLILLALSVVAFRMLAHTIPGMDQFFNFSIG